MKQSFTLFLFAFFLTASTFGAPPLRRTLSYPQSDGTRVTATAVGHDDQGWYVTEDGVALLPKDDGTTSLYYARREGDRLVATDRLAHNADERSDEEKAFIESLAVTPAAQRSLLFKVKPTVKFAAGNSNGLGTYGKASNGVLNSIGAHTIPIIMVEFQDEKFLNSTTTDKVTRLFNETGYTSPDDSPYIVGSVKDYFVSQSNGMFSPSFEVVAKITAANTYAYYGANSGSSKDVKSNELVSEAITAAMAAGADFSQYVETDRNGVPLVVIYHAGPGEHNSFEPGKDNYIWAKFNQRSFTAGTSRINSYFIGNEEMHDYKKENGSYVLDPVTGYPTTVDSTTIVADGIGVLCHELGHALGLPDFYTTNGATHLTLNLWSIMDYGEYWRDGYAPIGYTAYERNVLGWLDIVELDAATARKELYALGTDGRPTAYRVTNPSAATECFIFENRQPAVWFPAQMGSGLLVTHLNYNASRWGGNTVNNVASSLGFTVLPADGALQLLKAGPAAFQGDLFPGLQKVTSIEGLPFYTGTGTTPLLGIRLTDGIVSFRYGARIAGDANSDGTVSVQDAAAVVGYLKDNTQLIDTQAADLNADGSITQDDVQKTVETILAP